MKVFRVVVIPEVVGPGTNSSDVKTDVVLMGSGTDGERVELAGVLSSTSNLDPLPCLVVKVVWPLEVDTNHKRWKDVSTDHSQLLPPSADTDNLINCIDDTWSEEEVTKEWILDKTSRAMQEHQDVKGNIEVVGYPEGLESVAASVLGGKNEYNDSDQSQYESTEASHGQEQPECELWKCVSAVVHFSEDARQVIGCLGGDVVEVDTMADAMHDREAQASQCNNLVETDVSIEGDVVIEDGFSQVGDEVPGHGD